MQDSLKEIESSWGGIGGVECGVDSGGRMGAQVNELNGAAGAGLLAGGLRGGTTSAGGIDTLNAVGALLHHAARALADLRVWGCGVVVCVTVEVEVSGIVGAGGRTVAGAPATGVDHGIEPFVCMHGGVHGADGLARGLFALSAGGGEVECAMLRGGVAVDAQPLQVAVVGQISGTDGGDVVLSTAG